MKLWGFIQFDPSYIMEYFSTSGRTLRTGSWLCCHKTDYISVSNFTESHKKVISSRLSYLPIQMKPEIPVKTGSFRRFAVVKIFAIRPRKFFKSSFPKMRGRKNFASISMYLYGIYNDFTMIGLKK